METVFKEVCVLDKEGFVPTDIFVGEENKLKRVKLKIKVLVAPHKMSPAEISEKTEYFMTDREGFINFDPCWAYMAGAKVEVTVYTE
jgi:hypothetical protein